MLYHRLTEKHETHSIAHGGGGVLIYWARPGMCSQNVSFSEAKNPGRMYQNFSTKNLLMGQNFNNYVRSFQQWVESCLKYKSVVNGSFFKLPKLLTTQPRANKM